MSTAGRESLGEESNTPYLNPNARITLKLVLKEECTGTGLVQERAQWRVFVHTEIN